MQGAVYIFTRFMCYLILPNWFCDWTTQTEKIEAPVHGRGGIFKADVSDPKSHTLSIEPLYCFDGYEKVLREAA